MIVVDAHVIIYLVRDISWTPLARQVYAADPEWVVPPLWKSEVLNGLLQEVKAGHVGLEGAAQAVEIAARLLSQRVRDVEAAPVLRAAHESRLTAYDATYVVLARAAHILLITEDRKVQRACPDVARSMKQFLS